MRTAPSGQQVYSRRGVLLRYVPQVLLSHHFYTQARVVCNLPPRAAPPPLPSLRAGQSMSTPAMLTLSVGEVKSEDGCTTLFPSTGHVFRSSLKQHIWLQCRWISVTIITFWPCCSDRPPRAWSWSPPVEHCVSLKFLLEYGNSSVVSVPGSQGPVHVVLALRSELLEVTTRNFLKSACEY